MYTPVQKLMIYPKILSQDFKIYSRFYRYFYTTIIVIAWAVICDIIYLVFTCNLMRIWKIAEYFSQLHFDFVKGHYE